MLSNEQREMLLRPVKPQRVSETQGMSYLEAFDVIAHLTRAFGFEGWDKKILNLEQIFETGDDGRWTVAYRCSMRLTVRDPNNFVVKVTEDASTGEAINQKSRGDAHDLAIKSAVSGALKRCAKDLGDQFGLSLYDNGSTTACIKRVVVYPEISGVADEPVRSGEAVKPPSATPGHNPITPKQQGMIRALVAHLDLGDVHVFCADVIKRPVPHLANLTSAQASMVIDKLKFLEEAEERLEEDFAEEYPGEAANAEALAELFDPGA